jgi:hypothetical protein
MLFRPAFRPVKSPQWRSESIERMEAGGLVRAFEMQLRCGDGTPYHASLTVTLSIKRRHAAYTR